MVTNKKERLTRLATILGFLGMLRPHTFSQLGPESFTFVLTDGGGLRYQTRNMVSFREFMVSVPANNYLLGFYIEFESKTMTHGRAYYPNLAKVPKPYSDMCPTRELRSIANKDWLGKGFLKNVGRGETLRKYLQE